MAPPPAPVVIPGVGITIVESPTGAWQMNLMRCLQARSCGSPAVVLPESEASERIVRLSQQPLGRGRASPASAGNGGWGEGRQGGVRVASRLGEGSAVAGGGCTCEGSSDGVGLVMGGGSIGGDCNAAPRCSSGGKGAMPYAAGSRLCGLDSVTDCCAGGWDGSGGSGSAEQEL